MIGEANWLFTNGSNGADLEAGNFKVVLVTSLHLVHRLFIVFLHRSAVISGANSASIAYELETKMQRQDRLGIITSFALSIAHRVLN